MIDIESEFFFEGDHIFYDQEDKRPLEEKGPMIRKLCIPYRYIVSIETSYGVFGNDEYKNTCLIITVNNQMYHVVSNYTRITKKWKEAMKHINP